MRQTNSALSVQTMTEALQHIPAAFDMELDRPSTVSPAQLRSNGTHTDNSLPSDSQPIADHSSGAAKLDLGAQFQPVSGMPDAAPSLLPHWEESNPENEFNLPDRESAATVEGYENPAAFARLEFDDGDFYLNTYYLRLGRDMRAAQFATHEEIKGSSNAGEAIPTRPSSLSDVPQTPHRRSSSLGRSHLSESGGIVGMDHPHMGKTPRPRSRRNRQSKSSASSSRRGSHGEINAPIRRSYEVESSLVDQSPQTSQQHISQLQPNPWENPLLPIHPPQDAAGSVGGFKGISREHALISFDFRTGNFKLKCLGRNGLFHDSKYIGSGEEVVLHHRSNIQIGHVPITFVLPDRDEASQRSGSDVQSSSRISLTFENGKGENIGIEESSDSDSGRETSFTHTSDWDVLDEDESDVDEEVQDESDVERESSKDPKKQSLKLKLNNNRQTASDKRKTDRRKRQEEARAKRRQHEMKLKESREKKKAAKRAATSKRKAEAEEVANDKSEQIPTEDVKQEPTTEAALQSKDKGAQVETEAKEGMPAPEEYEKYGIATGTIIPKRKGPGRPPKDGIMSKREKALLLRQNKDAERARKMGLNPAQLPQSIARPKNNTKTRKDGEGEDDGKAVGDAAGDNGEGRASGDGEKRSSKSARPIRTPSPEMKESDFTEQELQRPVASYVILIHEAISNSRASAMNLQQIYAAIERRYPYFKFRTGTSGWQSSVRHNLNQHDAFVKKERDGKGFLWTVNPDVSIEREKKRRPSPPAPPPPPPASSHQRPYYPQPMLPPGGGAKQFHQPPFNALGQGRPPYNPISAPMPPPIPRLPPILGGPSPADQRRSTYSSPYASKPAPGRESATPPAVFPPQSKGLSNQGAGLNTNDQLLKSGRPPQTPSLPPISTQTSHTPPGLPPPSSTVFQSQSGPASASGTPPLPVPKPSLPLHSDSTSSNTPDPVTQNPQLHPAAQTRLNEFKTIFIKTFATEFRKVRESTDTDSGWERVLVPEKEANAELVLNKALDRVFQPQKYAAISSPLPHDEQIVVNSLRKLLSESPQEQKQQKSEELSAPSSTMKNVESAPVASQSLADIASIAAAATATSTAATSQAASNAAVSSTTVSTTTPVAPAEIAKLPPATPARRLSRAPSVEPLTPPVPASPATRSTAAAADSSTIEPTNNTRNSFQQSSTTSPKSEELATATQEVPEQEQDHNEPRAVTEPDPPHPASPSAATASAAPNATNPVASPVSSRPKRGPPSSPTAPSSPAAPADTTPATTRSSTRGKDAAMMGTAAADRPERVKKLRVK